MHTSKKLTLFIFTIVAIPCLLLAGGSTYSQYGYGDILRHGDGRTYAMGGTGIAFLDDGFINIFNPAGLARISFTRVSTGFEYNNFLSKDETGSSFYSTGGFQGLAFAFPISKEDGIVMSAEFTPYSKVSYGITSSAYDSLLQSQENKTFYGSGGLSYLGLGLSASPLKTLHIGARLNYMFGRVRQYQTTSFTNTILTPSTFDRNVYDSGFTFTFGTIYEGIADLLNIPFLRPLTVGLTLTSASSLDADFNMTYPESSSSSTDSVVTYKGVGKIPLSLGIGLSYLYENRYRFLGDIVTESWGDLESLNGYHPTNFRNSLRTSIGFEALPAKDADTFFKRLVYRAGVAYNQTYYKINGVGINEMLVSGGLGIPMGPESQLNIGLQLGVRGSTENHLQKDTIIRLSVSVSASEIWFLHFDEE
jgi:hypothetical protein